jgi:hypothetical protein
MSPAANYTDRATAVCRRNDSQLLLIEGAMWSAWRIPTAVTGFQLDLVQKLNPRPESVRELNRPSDHRLSAKLVPAFAGGGCHVVSVTESQRPYSRISRPEPLLFLPSSCSVFLTRLIDSRLDLVLGLENKDSMFLQHAGNLQPDYKL